MCRVLSVDGRVARACLERELSQDGRVAAEKDVPEVVDLPGRRRGECAEFSRDDAQCGGRRSERRAESRDNLKEHLSVPGGDVGQLRVVDEAHGGPLFGREAAHAHKLGVRVPKRPLWEGPARLERVIRDAGPFAEDALALSVLLHPREHLGEGGAARRLPAEGEKGRESHSG